METEYKPVKHCETCFGVYRHIFFSCRQTWLNLSETIHKISCWTTRTFSINKNTSGNSKHIVVTKSKSEESFLPSFNDSTRSLKSLENLFEIEWRNRF